MLIPTLIMPHYTRGNNDPFPFSILSNPLEEKRLFSQAIILPIITRGFQKGTKLKLVYMSLSHEILCYAMPYGRRQGFMVAFVLLPRPLRKKLPLGSPVLNFKE